VLAWRRLRRVEQTQRSRAKLHKLGNAAGLDILVGREKVLHRFRADAPFERTIDIGVEFFGGKSRAFIKREMQTEKAPGRVLERIELFEKCGGQLLAPDQVLECLMHIERRGDELFRAHGAAVGQFYASGPAILDDDATDIDLRLESTAGGNEGFHQSTREV